MNIAFIPVRCGSKSIPFKNIKNFCGKPLVYWNLKALENCVNIDEIYLATDCDEIKDIANSFNFSKVKVYNRDKENSQDTSSTESVMLEFINKKSFEDSDLFFLVQATSPLTQTKDFDEAIAKMKDENADSLLTCVRTKRFFWNEKASPINYDFNNRPRRQDFDGLFMENGAFYINSIFNIKKDKNRLSGKIAIYEMEEFTAVELDEEDDWIIAEKLMNKYILSKKIAPRKVKLFLSDVDGTLTDAGMYYGENGEEFKKFNTHDGKGFELLRKAEIKTGIITSEDTKIVENRAKKLKVDFLYQGLEHKGKLEIAKEICDKLDITLDEVAYIGDDINCKELLSNVGFAACPFNAVTEVKNLDNIIKLSKNGGEGVVREFIEKLFYKGYI
ncbi:acylneuraminate cytidylyltransferase [Poseidonibacter lekithochrous]|uniref:acylneuraminate cytidylyltransferase n=1 Tax=Poseidonibacter TaxID=2321187 RepID=UPI001C090B84|nr:MULTISPECIES: acylneuraminate cytidylyltransferase [Poseidonibacter]MBU3014701.1 acylneuraminate cytidylyltransferase [Poseidonibacter lekithochrous]MDO6827999.1 HAD hydrolase family protein [Poseidonibacter sp. 1_MG-2023]